MTQEKFEDGNRVTRRRKLMNDRQYELTKEKALTMIY
jgi:hypothetical protein